MRQAPQGERVPTRPVANWSRFVLPIRIAPASSRRCTTGAVSFATYSKAGQAAVRDAKRAVPEPDLALVFGSIHYVQRNLHAGICTELDDARLPVVPLVGKRTGHVGHDAGSGQRPQSAVGRLV